MNTFKRILLAIHLVICDICDRFWYMTDLKQMKEKHIQ
jgi:hypothetical protein